jgi:hypothetical protein
MMKLNNDEIEYCVPGLALAFRFGEARTAA